MSHIEYVFSKYQHCECLVLNTFQSTSVKAITLILQKAGRFIQFTVTIARLSQRRSTLTATAGACLSLEKASLRRSRSEYVRARSRKRSVSPELYKSKSTPVIRNHPIYIDKRNSNRSHISEYRLHPLFNLQTFTCICFCDQIIPAPSGLVAAEQCKHE